MLNAIVVGVAVGIAVVVGIYLSNLATHRREERATPILQGLLGNASMAGSATLLLWLVRFAHYRLPFLEETVWITTAYCATAVIAFGVHAYCLVRFVVLRERPETMRLKKVSS